MHPYRTIAVIAALCSLHCVKKQFVAFEKPHSVMQIRPKGSIEILQEPLKKEMIVWDSEKLGQIPVEGLLRVTYKNADYFYLQMNCPAELKCNGKKVYIPRNLTHAVDADKLPFKNEYTEPPTDSKTALFVLAESPQIEKLIRTREWLTADVKKEIPEVFDVVLFEANLPSANQLAYVGNLYFVTKSFENRQFMEKTAPEFAEAFPFYAEWRKNGTGGTPEANAQFLRSLNRAAESRYRNLLRKEIDDFPFANSSYKAMATAFNKISAPQMLKAELAGEIAKKTPFLIKLPGTVAEAVSPGGGAIYAQEPPASTPAPAPVKVEATNSFTQGVVFEYEISGKKNQIPVYESELMAFATDKGLGFQLGKDKDKAIILEPAEESTYLKSGNKAEIQKFVKAIPDYKAIAKDYDLDLALLRIAMKYGKGDINRRSGLFEYEIDLSKGRNFWYVLAAIKNNYGVTDDGTYSGEIPAHFMQDGGDRQKGSINWYQKYDKEQKAASFGIKGRATYCERSCYDVAVDIVCMENDEKLKVTFRPSAIYAKNADKDSSPYRSPNLHADFKEGKDNERSCADYLKIARTDEKFE